MSLIKRKKQKAKSLLPVLINPGPAPVAVNPFVTIKETGPEVIVGRRGGKYQEIYGPGAKPRQPVMFGPLQRGCSHEPPPPFIGCDIALKNSIEKSVLVIGADGNTRAVDITGMTTGQIQDVLKMYASMRDEVSEFTPENMEYIKNLLTDKERKRLLMGDWPPEK